MNPPVFRALWLIVLSGLALAAPAQCIQNPDFTTGGGWSLTSGGSAGTARVLGGFLEISVSFSTDFARARQECSSTAYARTVSVDIGDLGIGTVGVEIGWENAAGTDGDYVLVTQAGTAEATTTNPNFRHIIFRAERPRMGAAAQSLDNVVVTEGIEPTPENITNHLLEAGPEPANADRNGDGEVDAADIVMAVGPATP